MIKKKLHLSGLLLILFAPTSTLLSQSSDEQSWSDYFTDVFVDKIGRPLAKQLHEQAVKAANGDHETMEDLAIQARTNQTNISQCQQKITDLHNELQDLYTYNPNLKLIEQKQAILSKIQDYEKKLIKLNQKESEISEYLNQHTQKNTIFTGRQALSVCISLSGAYAAHYIFTHYISPYLFHKALTREELYEKKEKLSTELKLAQINNNTKKINAIKKELLTVKLLLTQSYKANRSSTHHLNTITHLSTILIAGITSYIVCNTILDDSNPKNKNLNSDQLNFLKTLSDELSSNKESQEMLRQKIASCQKNYNDALYAENNQPHQYMQLKENLEYYQDQEKQLQEQTRHLKKQKENIIAQYGTSI